MSCFWLWYEEELSDASRSTVFENHKKVSFYIIASEASYVYISSGQKFIDNAEISQFSQFETGGVPDKSISIVQKMVENTQIQNLKRRNFECFM